MRTTDRLLSFYPPPLPQRAGEQARETCVYQWSFNPRFVVNSYGYLTISPIPIPVSFLPQCSPLGTISKLVVVGGHIATTEPRDEGWAPNQLISYWKPILNVQEIKSMGLNCFTNQFLPFVKFEIPFSVSALTPEPFKEIWNFGWDLRS